MDEYWNWRARRDEIATHFQSDTLTDLYLNGVIDWNGNPVKDEPDWYWD